MFGNGIPQETSPREDPRGDAGAVAVLDSAEPFESPDPFGGWEDSELTDRVLLIEAERTRLDAEEVAVLREIERRKFLQYKGWRSVTGWLKQHARMSGATAAAKMRAARVLDHLPATRQAFDAGEVCFEQVKAITRFARPGTVDLLAEHESMLLEQAETLTVDTFNVAMCHWNERATQHLDPEPEAATKDQYMHLSESMGAWFGEIKLGAEDGAIVSKVLDEIGREIHEQQQRDGRVAHVLDPFTYGSEIRGLALVEMARRASAYDPATMRYREPAISLIITLDDLAQGLDAETTSGKWIPGETVKRLRCTSAITPIVVKSLSDPQPLDVGRTSRDPSPSQRKAVIARDRHCIFPGCDMPPERCEIHHRKHWADDGPTDANNLDLLCVRHHHLNHEGGWSYTRAADGSTVWRMPDGTILEYERDPRPDPPPAGGDAPPHSSDAPGHQPDPPPAGGDAPPHSSDAPDHQPASPPPGGEAGRPGSDGPDHHADLSHAERDSSESGFARLEHIRLALLADLVPTADLDATHAHPN